MIYGKAGTSPFKKEAKNLRLSAKRNKYLKYTIFCAQIGYKAVKILYFVF